MRARSCRERQSPGLILPPTRDTYRHPAAAVGVRTLKYSATLLAAGLLLGVPAAAQDVPKDQGDRYAGPAQSSRSPVLGRNGMVATSQPLATQVALDVLKRGGTAADAAIAANAMLGLLEPEMCGVGGDLFAIVWNPKTKRLYGLDSAGKSPAGLTPAALARLVDRNGLIPTTSWPAVTVPGAVDGWFALHARFGRLPMKALLAPAVDYAEQGVPLSQFTASFIKDEIATFERLAKEGRFAHIVNFRSVFEPNGAAPAEGVLFRNRDLARTYRLIADQGRDVFYSGRLARQMVAWLRADGAPHTLSDFEGQRSRWIEPVSIRYHGYDVFELPPPGQGAAALQMLKLLEDKPLRSLGRGNADYWHLLIEAKKLAYADRAAIYGDDPRFPLQTVLSDRYARERASLIDMHRAAVRPEAGLRPSKDTTYLTIADKDGMMVSLIQSNMDSMGSGLVPSDGAGRSLGFVLHDRGSAFTLKPGLPNSYAPSKRPFHTLMPAFVMKDGAPYLSFGVMGGDMQPQGQVQVLINILDFGMDVQAAGDAARFLHQGSADPDGTPASHDGGTVLLERGVPEAIADQLRARGHKVARAGSAFFGGYQAILRDPVTGVYWGASEFRFDGQAAGY